MLTIYRTRPDRTLVEVDTPKPKDWVHVTVPTEDEIAFIGKAFNIPRAHIINILDENEQPRVEKERGKVIVIFRVPYKLESEDGMTFTTYPVGVIFTKEVIITVCGVENEVIRDFITNHVKGFYTSKRVRFLLQMFNRTSHYFTIYLNYIKNEIQSVENNLLNSAGSEEILRLIKLQKSLQYFHIATVANNGVMQRMAAGHIISLDKEEQGMLDDIVIDTRQTIQMISQYSFMLTNIMSGYSSIISNKLNNILKFLTSITIIIAVPTMIASYYGMNVGLPMQGDSIAFPIIILLSILTTGLISYILFRRRLL